MTAFSRRAAWIPLAWMAVALGARLSWKPLGIGHDEALLLECGRLIAEGGRPYVDFFEMNPPLVMYLNALPAFAARALDVHAIAAFNVSLILLSAWSAWRALAIVGRWEPSRADAPPRGARLLESAIVAAPALVLAGMPPDSGQREHVFFLLYYPFLLLRAGRWSGEPLPRHTWAYGTAAALGVALKPYFLVAVLLPEVALAIRHRRWRPLVAPEAVAAACTGAAYLLHFLLLPDVRAGFFDRILPLVLNGYGAYDRPMAFVLGRVVRRGLVLLALLVVLWRLRPPDSTRPLVLPAGAFALATLLTVVVQRKGFGYHFQPVDQTLLLLLGMAAAAVALRAPRRSVPAIAGAAATAAILAAPVVQIWRTDAASPWAPLIERVSAPGDRVLVLSTSVTYAYPAVLQTGRRSGSRHLSAALPVIAIHASKHGMPRAAEIEAEMIEELKADVRRFEPAAVLIDRQRNCHGCPPGFRLHDYLERHGLLETMAPLYRRGRDEGELAVYVRR